MLNQTSVECFLSLAETLSFTKTARSLYITQQAVSKSILRLEEYLGFLLFIRTPRSVSLTNEGKRCYDLFKSLQSQYTQSLYEIKEACKSATITLAVGYQNWLDFGVEPNHAFSILCQEIPNLSLTGERHPPPVLRDRLLNKQLDLAFMCDTFFNSLVINEEHFCKQELFKAQQVIMVSPDNPLVEGGSTYKSFVREPFLFDMYEGESVAENNTRARKIIEQCGLKPKEIVLLPNRDSAYTEAEHGKGIVIGAEINYLAKTRILKTYSIGVEESMICVWCDGEKNNMVNKYVNYLQTEYRKRSAGLAEELVDE